MNISSLTVKLNLNAVLYLKPHTPISITLPSSCENRVKLLQEIKSTSFSHVARLCCDIGKIKITSSSRNWQQWQTTNFFSFFLFFFHTMKRIIRTISCKSILLFKITSIKNYVFISVHNKNFKIMNMWFGENTEIQKEVLSK